jgi:hypothetical protein
VISGLFTGVREDFLSGFDPKKLVIVAGMPRGGTTSLYHIFDQHPGCFVPFRKETAYFSYNFYKGEKWYKDLYRDRPDNMPGMDISPQYFVDLRSIDRIKALAPEAKVILSVRNPLEWIISSFFQTNKFEHKPSIVKFVDGYTITGARETLHCALADGYVERAIEAFRAAFGSNLLLYRFESFRDEPVKVLRAIEQFTGMEPYFTETTFKSIKVNSVTQYNWRWLTWVLSRESVISTIDTVLPRPVIRRVRLAVDRWTMPKTDNSGIPLSEAELAVAEKRLGPDRDWVNELFRTRAIQLGDGSPFYSPQPFEQDAEPTAMSAI